MSDKTDILIVGAGVVGSVASLLLADAGFSVRVLESKKLSYKSNLKKTAWVSSLNLTSEQVLRSVGAVFADFSDFATPVVELDVVDMHAGSIKFSASAIAKSHLSTIVDNAVLLQVLWSKMRDHYNITINDECQVDDIANNSDEVVVNGGNFSADLLLAADGARSKVRDMLGMRYSRRPYGHWALVATIKTDLPHSNIGRQWFHSTGPLAFLPIDNENSHAIVLSHAHADKYLDYKADDFAGVLGKMSDYALGEVHDCANLLCFPLVERHVRSYFDGRVCFLGDAAHSIHPLAGQGVNLGIADAKCLSHVLTYARQRSIPIASVNILNKYQRERRSENVAMLRAMRLLQEVTAVDSKVSQGLRKTGCFLADRSEAVKKIFMSFAN
jgi:2-polyprenylphenol 6-hydroxylase